mmetsp:Transcript_34350/g.99766  ORF Transcript_34350/g.99766 Transcript_34350/m.99766 type:complete len:93 (-) Transcript_34350:977-1255(-)
MHYRARLKLEPGGNLVPLGHLRFRFAMLGSSSPRTRLHPNRFAKFKFRVDAKARTATPVAHRSGNWSRTNPAAGSNTHNKRSNTFTLIVFPN